MRYLQKLPLLLALTAAFLTGIIGFIRIRSQNEILVQMVLNLILFFILGLFARSTCMNIKEQTDKRIKEKELELLDKQQKENDSGTVNDGVSGRNIDLSAGDDGEIFEPLPVSEFIKKELKRDG